jgi:hypothetical protein
MIILSLVTKPLATELISSYNYHYHSLSSYEVILMVTFLASAANPPFSVGGSFPIITCGGYATPTSLSLEL